MGLFSKKSPCHICGGKIPFFLPTKIEGEYICDECYTKVDMQADLKSQLTLQGLRTYLAFYEKNQAFKDRFVVSQKLDFGCFDTKMIFDFENRMFCLSKQPDKTVFQGAQLKSFTIKEDDISLFEGSPKGLMRYTSTVPDCVMALAPQIKMLEMTQQMAESLERFADDDDNNNKNSNHNKNNYRPSMDICEPFQQFYVELHMDHPYWQTIKCDMAAPTFSNDHPDINEYMREYQQDIEVIEQLVKALMEVSFPGTGEIMKPGAMGRTGGGAVGVDATAEIRKCKALLEDGIITKEEFDAKKKQLLGI